MTDNTAPLLPELPDPARFTLNTYVVTGQVYQRKQDDADQWHWVAIHPPALRERPTQLP